VTIEVAPGIFFHAMCVKVPELLPVEIGFRLVSHLVQAWLSTY
jgi:hypothetical protein